MKKLIYVAGVILFTQFISLNSVLADESRNPRLEAGRQKVEKTDQQTENEAGNNENEDKVPVMSEKEKKNEVFLLQIRQQLQNARNDYFQVSKNISDTKERLVGVSETITTLKEQIENLDYLISNTQAKIRNVEKQIAEKENMIEVLEEEIKIKEIELENQKLLLKDYLKLLYLQENSFYDRSDKQKISVTKLLLADSSIGDTFQEIQYFTILEQTGQNIFDRIDNLKKSLNNQQKNLKETKEKLSRLKKQLTEEKKNLQIHQNAKNKLLKRTQGEEKIYRELIAESKRQQLNLIAEINTLKQSLSFIEKKIVEEGDNFDPDNYSGVINKNVRAIYDFEMSGEFESGERLNWPVKPTRGISAYYLDPSYHSTFGIPHNAIDIPISQGTAVRSPAAGVVYKVHDNGDESYSYLILAHKGGLLTVYGHMSEILVKERDIVFPGEIVGLSGGIPGTKGAGYLTTGAHLHFEVIKSGKHIDPLKILPLEKLATQYIPDKYKTDDEEMIEEKLKQLAKETD
jgi:murein DD-endopeptidase MepM/ murein hydrolase activator NlpD